MIFWGLNMFCCSWTSKTKDASLITPLQDLAACTDQDEALEYERLLLSHVAAVNSYLNNHDLDSIKGGTALSTKTDRLDTFTQVAAREVFPGILNVFRRERIRQSKELIRTFYGDLVDRLNKDYKTPFGPHTEFTIEMEVIREPSLEVRGHLKFVYTPPKLGRSVELYPIPK